MNLRKAVKNAYYSSIRHDCVVGVYRKKNRRDDWEIREIEVVSWQNFDDGSLLTPINSYFVIFEADYIFAKGEVRKSRGTGRSFADILDYMDRLKAEKERERQLIGLLPSLGGLKWSQI